MVSRSLSAEYPVDIRQHPWTRASLANNGCPTCHVRAGVWCVTRTGGPSKRLHRPREEFYRKLYYDKAKT